MRLHRNPVLPLLLTGLLGLGILTGCGASGTSPLGHSTATLEAAKKKPAQKSTRTFTVVRGTVTELLPDDSDGLPHQLFLVKLAGQVKVIRCAHNTRLAPKVPLAVGSMVEIKGVYIPATPMDVIHWTHHDPRGREGGYVKLADRVFQ